jgi:uncharacterized protein with ParB-like and HNH nuclease domain
MKTNEITFKPLNIQDACTNKQYLIPEYQREYVWTEREVKQFLEDIFFEFDENTQSEYFIGCIVVCVGEDGLIEVIDGQQRLTTILLVLQAIRSLLSHDHQSQINKISDLSKSSYTTPSGKEVNNYTVKLDYDGKEILEKIIDGVNVDNITTNSISGGNLIDAFRNAKTFFETNFSDDLHRESLVKFYGYFVNNVKLVQIATQDIQSALKIFETINDRGVSLDSVDLLKNLLFAQVHRDEFKKIRGEWMEFKKPLDKARERPLRFLRYFLMSTYDTFNEKKNNFILREDDVYRWLLANEAKCKYQSSPSTFISKMQSAAEYYVETAKGKLDGVEAVSLSNLQKLVGSGSKQQAALLLSAMPLKDKSKRAYYHFVEQLEVLFFYYIITKEPAKLIEKRFAQWSQSLRLVTDAPKLNTFLSETFLPEIQERDKVFDFNFSQLTYKSFPKYRMKYILSRITQYVNKSRLGEKTQSPIDEYLRSSVQIEHILPLTHNEELLKAFSGGKRDVYEEYRNKFGNFTLLERPINSAIGRNFYEIKQKKYKASNYYLTKSLAGFDDGGKKDSIARTNAMLKEFSEWTPESIDDRQEMLRKLSKELWKFSLYEK